MKPIQQIIQDQRAAGLDLDPVRTAMILNYEAGFVARESFYISFTSDPVEKAGRIQNLKAELSDLAMQFRVIAGLYDFTIQELYEMGEARLDEAAGRRQEIEKRRNASISNQRYQYKRDGD